MLKFNFDKLKQTLSSTMLASNNPYTLTLRGTKGSKLTIAEMDNNLLYLDNNVVGTPSQVAYFGEDGNLTSDDIFTRTTESTLIGNEYWTPNYPQFTGGGDPDIRVFTTTGYYTGPTNSVYTVTISATGSSFDFFDWSSTTGGSGSNVEILNVDMELDSEISVYFGNKTGHNIGDFWEVSMIPMKAFMSSGNAIGISGIITGTIDETNGIISVNLVGSGTGRPSGAVFGVANQLNNTRGLVNITSENGSDFGINIASVGMLSTSELSIDNSSISFNFDTGAYYFPTTNGQGPMVNDGDGNLSFQTGFNGTYSTGEGQIVTVTNGIISSVVYPA